MRILGGRLAGTGGAFRGAVGNGTGVWVGYEYLRHSIASLLPSWRRSASPRPRRLAWRTLGERLRREAESSGRLLVLPPHVTAYAKSRPNRR